MDVREKYVMQKVNRKEKSICPNCIHHNLCIAENNQPCFECNRFIDANGVTVQKWISSSEPPTRKDADKYCRVLAMEMGMMELVNYKGPINYPDRFPYWMPLPKPPKGE